MAGTDEDEVTAERGQSPPYQHDGFYGTILWIAR